MCLSVCVCLTFPVTICFCCPPGMGLYNVIFIITSPVTDLLFSFLLPHFFSSIYVWPGSMSANSVVAIPGIFRVSNCLCSMAPSLGQVRRAAILCVIDYHISCHFLGCLTLPGLTTLFFHPEVDWVHSRLPMFKPWIHGCGCSYWHQCAWLGFLSHPACVV